MNLSLNINIANIVLKIGIKCKNIPDLLEPINEIPLIQKNKGSQSWKKHHVT